MFINSSLPIFFGSLSIDITWQELKNKEYLCLIFKACTVASLSNTITIFFPEKNLIAFVGIELDNNAMLGNNNYFKTYCRVRQINVNDAGNKILFRDPAKKKEE